MNPKYPQHFSIVVYHLTTVLRRQRNFHDNKTIHALLAKLCVPIEQLSKQELTSLPTYHKATVHSVITHENMQVCQNVNCRCINKTEICNTKQGIQTRVLNYICSYFSSKTYVMGTQKQHLNEMVLLSIKNLFLD